MNAYDQQRDLGLACRHKICLAAVAFLKWEVAIVLVQYGGCSKVYELLYEDSTPTVGLLFCIISVLVSISAWFFHSLSSHMWTTPVTLFVGAKLKIT